MADVPHLGFIVAAYAVTAVALVGTVLALLFDRRAQERALSQLSQRDDL